MDDLISREQAIKSIEEEWDGCCSEYPATQIIYDTTEAIERLPIIQPKRGKWIKTARWGRVYYCDQCRNYLDFDGVNAGRGSTNYCPNCGAKMGGQDD